MDLTRGQRRALLIATLWTPVFAVADLTILVLMSAATSLRWPGGEDPAWVASMLYVLFPLMVATVVVNLVVTVVYAYLILKRFVAGEGERLTWLILVILGGSIGQIFFYFLKIKPRAEARRVGVGSGS